MQILIILAHPAPGSFNHAIAETAKTFFLSRGHEVIYHDLYAEYYDPVLPADEIPKTAEIDSVTQQYCEELKACDVIIVVHPNWWGQPPAVLKGWIDRVLRPGVAYEFMEADAGEGIPNGLLRARYALVFNTSNTSADREDKLFLDPLETIWKNCIFSLCGVKNFHRKMFRIVVTSSEAERKKWLKQVEKLCAIVFE